MASAESCHHWKLKNKILKGSYSIDITCTCIDIDRIKVELFYQQKINEQVENNIYLLFFFPQKVISLTRKHSLANVNHMGQLFYDIKWMMFALSSNFFLLNNAISFVIRLYRFIYMYIYKLHMTEKKKHVAYFYLASLKIAWVLSNRKIYIYLFLWCDLEQPKFLNIRFIYLFLYRAKTAMPKMKNDCTLFF